MRYPAFISEHKKHITVLACTIVVISLAACWLISGRNSDHLVMPSAPIRPTLGGNAPSSGPVPEYDYSKAPDHIGERATIRGMVVKTFTAKSGVTFFDFCQSFDGCPFSAVIFASDLSKFGDLSRYVRAVKVTGVIRSYQGAAEMVLDSPDEIE